MEQSSTQYPISCDLSGSTLLVRAEGLSELLGDIIIDLRCDNAAAPGGIESIDVLVTLNVNVTNRFIEGSTTDAALIADDPVSGEQVTTVGERIAPATLLFQNVQLRSLLLSGHLRARVTKLRGNASQLGIPNGEGSFDSEVRAYVAFRGAISVPVSNNPLPLGSPRLGLLKRLRSGERPDVAVQQLTLNAVTRNSALLRDPQAAKAVFNLALRHREGFSGAFKTRLEEGDGATNGTRFIARFYEIPEQLRVFVTTRDVDLPIQENGPTMPARVVIVRGADPQGVGGTIGYDDSVGRSSIQQVQIYGGFGFCVWEWQASESPSHSPQQFFLGVAFAVEPNGGVSASVQIRFGLAPISVVSTSSKSQPIPRFIDAAPRLSMIVSAEGSTGAV